ncbi:MAG: efflux RND transporter permease subunit, partial [Verrucomicrobiota bacterium]
MIAWFTRNGVAANLLLAAVFLVGLWSAVSQVTYEVFPSSKVETIQVQVTFRGATPGEVEEAILLPLEEAIQDVAAIKQISASAVEGSANLSVEVKTGFSARDALDDIKNRIDAVTTLPALAEIPTVSITPRLDSVVKVILAGSMEEMAMRRLADDIFDDITSLTARTSMPAWVPFRNASFWESFTKVETISSASYVGARPYEIAIEIPERTLLRYDLTLDEVAQAIRVQSVDLSGGLVQADSGEILLRTREKAYRGDEFEALVVRSQPDGTQLTLGDLGSVRDGFEEAMVDARFNGLPAILISVNRVGDQNAIAISDAVTQYVEEKQATLPPGVTLSPWRDRSTIVRGRLQTLWKSALGSLILVFTVLALFLRIGLAFWVVLGIPVSFAGALILLPHLGASINIASLFGFILVLGIVVDDAIVTGENIVRRLETEPDPTLAAIKGTHEVTLPVTLGVLTTAVAFLPLFLIPGNRGAMYGQIAGVVIPVLLFSLIESKLILPAHLKHLKLAKDLHRERASPLVRAQQW